jgi:hypothetical protein
LPFPEKELIGNSLFLLKRSGKAAGIDDTEKTGEGEVVR